MTNTPDESHRPPHAMEARPKLYVGHSVPFERLEPEPFASFVHGALDAIAIERGWTGLQQPDVGADGGFDSWATNAAGARVCIQCKRYEVISLPEVTLELAKVALVAALEGSTVREHLFVTSGRVRDVLRSALREESRTRLRTEALERARADKLANWVARAEAAGIDVDAVVDAYVAAVEITVWSGHEFDRQLALVWPRIEGLLERTFVLQPLVRESPRPDFDEDQYRLNATTGLDTRFVDPLCQPGPLPDSIRVESAANPRLRAPPGTGSVESTQTIQPTLEALRSRPAGGIYLLVGAGGAGKTTALEQLRAALLHGRQSDPESVPLPVLVPATVGGGSLDDAIHSALAVHRGHWISIPGELVLLIDGLDEAPVAAVLPLCEALRHVVSSGRVAVIVSTRDAGPRIPAVLPLTQALHVLPFGPGQVAELARKELAAAAVAPFVDSWLELASSDSFLASPQAVAAAVHAWSRDGALPTSHRALLEDVLDVMRSREKERFGPLPSHLAGFPQEPVEDLARRLVERTWFETGARMLAVDAFQRELPGLLGEARQAGSFGADALNSRDAEILLQHHGFVVPVGHQVRLPHDTICAYLVSPTLAANWRELVRVRSGREHDRSWLAAASLIPVEERSEFLRTAAAVDLVFASRLAREASALDDFVPTLLDAAEAANSEYRSGHVATALAEARTPKCIELLRAWTNSPGHRGVAAHRALARYGDAATVEAALRDIEASASVGIGQDGESTRLWRSSPITSRVAAARAELADRTDGALAVAFDTIRSWGTPDDVPLLKRALTQNVLTIGSWQRGVLALHSLDPEEAAAAVSDGMSEASVEFRVYVIEVALAVGVDFDVRFLVDDVLAPPDPPSPVLTIGSASDNRRIHALELLKNVALPREQERRVLDAIGSTDMHTRSWAWSIAQTCRIPAAIERARAAVRSATSSDEELHHATRVLAAPPVPFGLAHDARERFAERFPSRLTRAAAHALGTLCEVDGDFDGSSGITRAVFNDLASAMDDEATRTQAQFDLGQWGDRVAAERTLLEELGPLRVLDWDLTSFRGTEELVAAALLLADVDQLLSRLLDLSPLDWRCRVVLLCAEVRPELRPRLVPVVATTLLDASKALAPRDLLDAARACWTDEIAEATVRACLVAETQSSRIAVSSRTDPYLSGLGDCFTVDQAARFIQPALRAAKDEHLRMHLRFTLERARHRR